MTSRLPAYVPSHRERIRKGIYPEAMVPVVEELLDEIERLREALRVSTEIMELIEVESVLTEASWDDINHAVSLARGALEGGDGL